VILARLSQDRLAVQAGTGDCFREASMKIDESLSEKTLVPTELGAIGPPRSDPRRVKCEQDEVLTMGNIVHLITEDETHYYPEPEVFKL